MPVLHTWDLRSNKMKASMKFLWAWITISLLGSLPSGKRRSHVSPMHEEYFVLGR